MIFMHLRKLGKFTNSTIIVGIVISLIVLSLGAFLYMRSEGEDVSPLDSDANASVDSAPSILEASVQGEPMVISDGQDSKPFIMALIPGDAVLENGVYSAPIGSKLRIRVRAINVENGVLYYRPNGSVGAELNKGQEIGVLKPSDIPGEYEVEFEVREDTSGLLVALMKGKDGQEVQLSVNVAVMR